MMTKPLSVVGKRLPRVDAIEKATGKAQFIGDLKIPRMLYAKTLRSPYPHARIVNIDVSKAEALAGVKCVLTYKNVPRIHPPAHTSGLKFEYLLDDTMHCTGEAVAIVAAVTEEVAEAALSLIDVKYEVLPAVFDPKEAMKPSATILYPELGSNIVRCARSTPEGAILLAYGDVEEGFREADHIIEGNYETPMQYNCSPEPRAVICEWYGERLTCWASTQIPHVVRKNLSDSLNIPLSKIRVLSIYSAGGYGAKSPDKYCLLAAIAAKRTGRPVRIVFSREEDIIGTHHRSAYQAHIKVGVKNDGTITAQETRIIENYCRDAYAGLIRHGASAGNTCGMQYRWKNTKFEGYPVLTNIVDTGAMNGFGDPEANLCLERVMDEAAEVIGMDPVEFRLRNCMRGGDKAIHHRWLTTTGPINWGVLDQSINSFQECIRKTAKASHWKEKWKGWRTPVEINGTKRKGIGIAIGLHHTVYYPYSADIKMNKDGSVDVFSGAVEMGQGCATAMAQVVAETLSLDYEDVNVILGDTSVSGYGIGNIGSCGTSSAISAAKRAADDLKKKMFGIAAKKLGVNLEDLKVEDRTIYVKSDPDKKIPIAEIAEMGFNITGSAVNPTSLLDESTGKEVFPYSVCATVTEVDVDVDNGEVNVTGVWSAHDCGTAINPQILENQISLAIIQSFGYVLMEGLIVDKKTGEIVNSTLLDYKIPTILDIPKRQNWNMMYVEFPTPWGAFGSKGMSETGSSTGCVSLMNAIYNAIGVRIRGDSCSPTEILKALGKIH